MTVEKRPQQPPSFWTNSQNSAPDQFTLTSPEEGDEMFLQLLLGLNQEMTI